MARSGGMVLLYRDVSVPSPLISLFSPCSQYSLPQIPPLPSTPPQSQILVMDDHPDELPAADIAIYVGKHRALEDALLSRGDAAAAWEDYRKVMALLLRR